LELGWEKKDFPSKWNPRWHALVKQPRELTPHRTSIALASLHSVVKYFLSAVWKILRPKLETILQEHALAQAQNVIRIRRDQREAEFEPFWDEFVVSRSWDLTPPWALPRFVDACELPAIDRMLAEDESKIPVTAERWQMAIDSVPDDLTEFANQVMRDVLTLLHTVNVKIDDTATVGTYEEADPLSIFERASSLISCGAVGCQNLLTFPAILQEEHVTPYRHFSFHDRKWADLLSRLRYEPEVLRAASHVLKALGLPNNTQLAALDGIGRRLLCLCGNPQFRRPLDFRSLVSCILECLVPLLDSILLRSVILLMKSKLLNHKSKQGGKCHRHSTEVDI